MTKLRWIISDCISCGVSTPFSHHFFPQKIPFCPNLIREAEDLRIPRLQKSPSVQPGTVTAVTRQRLRDTQKCAGKKNNQQILVFLTGDNWLVVFHQPL